ncbi:Slr0243 protein [Geminocystis sp. NIES-3709]|nr:Slr0243 protein [Geminocystis sp. NIES-3709]
MSGIKRKLIIYMSILLLCVACGREKPPLEFAPSPSIIEKALIFKLEYQQESLSRQLRLKKPNFIIKKINVTKIEPTIVFNLPTYHLEGTYKVKIKQNTLKNVLIDNTFNLDLQRQSRGKTWRILLKLEGKKPLEYLSYLIH